MGISRSAVSEVNADSLTITNHDRRNKQKGITQCQWPTARSLRPNTLLLAEACIEGDEEAIAIRDAWQFHTDKATRLVTLTKQDGQPASKHDLENYSAPLAMEESECGVESLSEDGIYKALDKAVSKECKYTTKEKAIKEDKPETFVEVTESRDEITQRLNAAMAAYKQNPTDGHKELWDSVYLFAHKGAEGFKQQSLRLVGRDDDLINGFTAHAMGKVEAGKFTGIRKPKKGKKQFTGPVLFSNWLSTVFRHYANGELNRLTKEKFDSGISEPDPDARDGEAAVKKGYISTDVLSASSAKGKGCKGYLTADQLNRNEANEAAYRQEVNAGLATLSQTDQTYAAFLMQGVRQKNAAEALDESVVTSRKREQRIRIALGEMEVAAPHPDATEGTSTPVMGSTGTLAEVSL